MFHLTGIIKGMYEAKQLDHASKYSTLQGRMTNATAAFQENYCDWQKHKLPLNVLRKHINKHNNPISPFPSRDNECRWALQARFCVYWNLVCLGIKCLCQDRVSKARNPIYLPVPRDTMCRGSPGTTSVKEIKSEWISMVYLHVTNTIFNVEHERTCFIVNLARSFVKTPHLAVVCIKDSWAQKQHTWLRVLAALHCRLTRLGPDLLAILLLLFLSHGLSCASA